jgi:ectoine hydroxylase-related dioxygenase (phytanoyl-CoA dioxygenase family)
MFETAFIAGQPVPPALLGPLHEAGNWREQPQRLPGLLARDGYLLLRRALDRQRLMAARHEVLRRLAEVGEIAEPHEQAIATGGSRRAELWPDLGAFWRGVCEAPVLRAVSHGGELRQIAEALFGQPCLPFDFLWLRTMVQGRASPLHFDHVYMNRGSQRVVTAWLPLGDVPLRAGPLLVVEGSNRFADLIEHYRGVDVDRDPLPGSFPEDAVAFARGRGTRLLSAEFEAGDLMLFDMFTLHGSFDNRLAGGQVRLSCDVRWQPAADARDDRWFGHPPAGHRGQGYAGLNGARPLGEAYSAR